MPRLAALLPLLLAAALVLAAPAAAARPNIVIVETDDQTAESLWAMPRTQALIGGEGTAFRNSFVSLALCCPSRATLLTGRYAHNHGVLDLVPPRGGYERLDHTETLAVWLQRAGYATVLLGKYLNHYGRRDPTEVPAGWTEWHGLVDPSTYSYYGYTINDGGMLTRYGFEPFDYQTDVLTRRAEEIIARRAAADEPFLLWASYLAPHNGLPRELRDPLGMATPVAALRHEGTFTGTTFPRTPAFDEADVSDKPPAIRRRLRLSWMQRWSIDEHYRQELESLQAVDEGVERIVDALRRSGELEDTLIVFTSDNGYLHGEHRAPFGKVLPYEPSIRVPLLIRGPGVPRGEVRDQLVANVDIAPTLLEAAGASAPWVADGVSLFSFLRDPGLETGRDILIESPARRSGALRFAGLRSRTHLYVERDTGQRELYDLRRDPDELRSLDRAPADAALEAALAARLARLRTCAGESCRPGPDLRLAAGAREGCHAAVRLAGSARARVRGVRYALDGLPARRVARAPFRLALGAGASTVAARVTLVDDRVVTLERRLRACY